MASTGIQKATTTPTTSSGDQLAVAETRELAVQRLGSYQTVEPMPADQDRKSIYLLMMKIGATGELPSERALKDAVLNDFWLDLYWKNPNVPGQIPFSVIIREFKTYAVHHSEDRRGNNQAEIIRQFNHWIKRPEVLKQLTYLRNEFFPELKPKELEVRKSRELKDYSDAELKEELAKAKAAQDKFPIPFVKEWIGRIELEMANRKGTKSAKD